MPIDAGQEVSMHVHAHGQTELDVRSAWKRATGQSLRMQVLSHGETIANCTFLVPLIISYTFQVSLPKER